MIAERLLSHFERERERERERDPQYKKWAVYVCGYMLVATVVIIYIYKRLHWSINSGIKDPTRLICSETIPALYQYLSCLEPEVISSTIYIYIYAIYQFQYQVHTCPVPAKNQSWTQYQDWAGCDDSSFKRTQYQDQAGMSKSWYPTNNMDMDGCNTAL
jgi:hypothetical protein